MAPKIDDSWLWLGLGVSLFFATRAISNALQDSLNLTLLRSTPQKHICPITSRTEDEIDSGSLTVLAQSEDKNIRDSASRILADRFVASQPAITSLAYDLFSANPSTSARAQVLLSFLRTWATNARPLAWMAQKTAETELVRAVGGEGLGASAMAAMLRTRALEDSVEEMELRRRRREAVVFHEGGGEVSQRDIIQRRGTGERRFERVGTAGPVGEWIVDRGV